MEDLTPQDIDILIASVDAWLNRESSVDLFKEITGA